MYILKLLQDEHRPARICVFASRSLDGGGDAGLCGFEHVDVDVFPAVTKRVIDEVLGQHKPELLTPLILTAALAFMLEQGPLQTARFTFLLVPKIGEFHTVIWSLRSPPKKLGRQLDPLQRININPEENMARTWKSKKDKRDAAAAFLRKTITDPNVRSAVLKDRKAAHQLFEREGGINIPDDVEVICVGPSTQERDRLVVFALPPEGTPTEQIDPLKYWIAAWTPYAVHPVAMSTEMKGETVTGRNWTSKKDRRDTAAVFLRKTITDPSVRSAVLKDREAAHKLFEREGGINIPDDVEVICIGPSTQERDRLVVFVLPPESTPIERIDPLKYWIAAWLPYATDPVTTSLPNAQIESGTLAPSLQVRS